MNGLLIGATVAFIILTTVILAASFMVSKVIGVIVLTLMLILVMWEVVKYRGDK